MWILVDSCPLKALFCELLNENSLACMLLLQYDKQCVTKSPAIANGSRARGLS